jgi:hypothetical protein
LRTDDVYTAVPYAETDDVQSTTFALAKKKLGTCMPSTAFLTLLVFSLGIQKKGIARIIQRLDEEYGSLAKKRCTAVCALFNLEPYKVPLYQSFIPHLSPHQTNKVVYYCL